jgi:hypothetical protein
VNNEVKVGRQTFESSQNDEPFKDERIAIILQTQKAEDTKQAKNSKW